jgi:porphobilinogen synthase
MTITPTAAAPQLQAADLAMVLLVRDDDRPGPVPTVRLAELAEVTRRLTSCGVSAVKVFASGRRDALGWGGSMRGCLMARAVREIKNAEPGMAVMTETCLCSYTLTGDCHLADTGVPDVRGTVETLAAQAVVQAAEGADRDRRDDSRECGRHP